MIKDLIHDLHLLASVISRHKYTQYEMFYMI